MPAPGHNSSTELSFPLKLFHITETEPKVLKWNLEHDSFRIIDEDDLVNRVLPQHFRTSRFSSFTRNLNIYGFKKIAKGEFAGSYYHPDFKKGAFDAASRMRRCVRRVADAEPVVKNEGKPTRKPPQGRAGDSGGKRLKPAAPQHAGMTRSFEYEDEVRHKTVVKLEPVEDSSQHSSQLSMSSCDGTNLWTHTTPCEDHLAMEHELALPPSPNGVDDEAYPNFYAGTPAACSSTPPSLLESPLAEDDDLTEWKEVLCFTSNNCPDAVEVEQQPRHANKGANAYCIQVPAGPLGATLECQNERVFLSKVTDPRSPLAHVPVGAQLVNLDGQDTTKMAAGQVAKLDESSCRRTRMVIFALTQCWDTALLAVTPTLPQSRPCCEWEPPKAKCIRDDVDMDTGTNDDNQARPGSPLCSSNSSWLKCTVDAL